MLYVSKIDKANSLIHITDTDDGVVDAVTQGQLKEIIKLGVVIDGTSYVDGKLCIRAIKQVKDISGLIAKLTTFGDYEEFGCFRFNTEYNIGWIFKDAVLDNDTFSPFKRKLETNSQVRLYVLPNVTRIEPLFAECKVKSLDLSSFNTRNVTDMSYMFWRCQVKSLDLSHFDTSKVTNMSYMFQYGEVEVLDLSSFNTRNVIMMAGMFEKCRAESLDLSSFDTRTVTDMSYMFDDCAVKSLDLSSFDTRNVTDMRSMFALCQISRIIVKDARIIEQLKIDGFRGKIIRV